MANDDESPAVGNEAHGLSETCLMLSGSAMFGVANISAKHRLEVVFVRDVQDYQADLLVLLTYQCILLDYHVIIIIMS